MRPTIGRWHTRYRVAGEGREGMARIESSVRERVAESYATALEQLFGGDPAVYVLRRVRTELTVVNPSAADDLIIARKWAERACQAVVHTVTRHGDDVSQVMRFEDTAVFVAQWIADLLDGVAWDRWYYGAFSRYRALSVEDAIRVALIEYREHLAAILRHLGTIERLSLLLSRVSPDSARELWRSAIRGEQQEPSDEQFRVFLRAAFEIADALQVWRAARPQETETVVAYCATSPQSPDWKQPRALAEAVFAALAFLERRGFVSIDRTVLADVVRLHEAIATLEWLDREWLAAAVEAWMHDAPVEEFAARPPSLTALQQRIIEPLRQLIASGAVVLAEDPRASGHNALALFAALAATEPQLASHPAAPAAIEALLQALAPAAAADCNAVTRALGSVLVPREGIVISSAYAGIFLLSRAILEARLPQLAAAFGLPVEGVLRALAIEWSTDPLDPGIVFWTGCEEEPEPLDAARCELLRTEIVRLMRDRAAFARSLAPDEQDARAPLASIASHLLRLWAHWLPGVAQSTAPWLLRQLILRRGVLRIDVRGIAVSLAPAPLDVVLEMAGYLAPIASLPWRADRGVTFAIDRSLA